jgi:predicted transcriptional regulator
MFASTRQMWTPKGEDEKKTVCLIVSSAQFAANFTPPDYVLVGVLIRRFVYSLTGMTGSGKTCVTLRLAASVALGVPFAGRLTKKCRVLYAAAENPDDVRMRWIALAAQMGFDTGTIEVYFTAGTFKISETAAKLREEAIALGGEFGLAIIDTGPTFFEGDDESSRTQMLAHARMMRGLIDVIPGGPTVMVNVHPVKNATADNLLPAGGGTFINEVDGNLTCAKRESLTELHWHGKFRGPEFGPMNFQIQTVTNLDLKDSDGRLLPTVVCEYVPEEAAEEMAAVTRMTEDEVLKLIDANPTISLTKIARDMGWKLHGGEPNKPRAQRFVQSLKKAKLIEKGDDGRGLNLTAAGKKAIKAADEIEALP